MDHCDLFIDKLKKELPEICYTRDLVKFGVYRNEQAAYHARKKGISSEFFQMPSGMIAYPKQGIIELLENCKHGGINENNDSRKPHTESTSAGNSKRLRL